MDAGARVWIPGSGMIPGEGHGSSLQFSCQENPMNRSGVCWALLFIEVTKWDMTEWLTLSLSHSGVSGSGDCRLPERQPCRGGGKADLRPPRGL